MTYDQFKNAWIRALRESGMPIIGVDPVEEILGLRSMDRTCRSFVEPFGGQDSEPFHVSAALEYRWDALKTARTATTEEDLLVELLGREQRTRRVRTERPWLRVDVTLRASLPYGQASPLPRSSAWASWAREARDRLARIEPVIPESTTREGRDGRLEILAWQGEPTARVTAGSDGELKLEAVELATWQAIELPRWWDDSSRRPDRSPDDQLLAMFSRLRAALGAWMEALDHLHPRPR